MKRICALMTVLILSALSAGSAHASIKPKSCLGRMETANPTPPPGMAAAVVPWMWFTTEEGIGYLIPLGGGDALVVGADGVGGLITTGVGAGGVGAGGAGVGGTVAGGGAIATTGVVVVVVGGAVIITEVGAVIYYQYQQSVAQQQFLDSGGTQQEINQINNAAGGFWKLYWYYLTGRGY